MARVFLHTLGETGGPGGFRCPRTPHAEPISSRPGLPARNRRSPSARRLPRRRRRGSRRRGAHHGGRQRPDHRRVLRRAPTTAGHRSPPTRRPAPRPRQRRRGTQPVERRIRHDDHRRCVDERQTSTCTVNAANNDRGRPANRISRARRLSPDGARPARRPPSSPGTRASRSPSLRPQHAAAPSPVTPRPAPAGTPRFRVGHRSPIVVTGLDNGSPYTCTVTASQQRGRARHRAVGGRDSRQRSRRAAGPRRSSSTASTSTSRSPRRPTTAAARSRFHRDVLGRAMTVTVSAAGAVADHRRRRQGQHVPVRGRRQRLEWHRPAFGSLRTGDDSRRRRPASPRTRT